MKTARDPLAGVDLLLVDGTNLLHALRGTASEVGPPAAVVGRLRGVIPPAISIEVVLDGPPERGLATARIASGIGVRYSGRRSADDLIVQLVRDRVAGEDRAGRVLVVSDDRELGARLRRWDARIVGTAWLIGRLGRARLSSPSSGRPAPAAADVAPGSESANVSEEEGSARGRWQPGRGATAKHGNPRRSAKRRSGAEPGRRG